MLTSRAFRQPLGSWVLPLLITSAAAALGAWFGAVRNRSTEAGLVIAPADLDFGEAWVQEGFQCTVPVSNVGDRAIDVLRVSGSCDCSEIAPGHFVLEPGETEDLLVTLRLVPKSREQADGEVWDFSVDLKFETRTAPPGSLRWTLRGRVRNSLSITPPVLQPRLIAGETPLTVAATVNSRLPLSALDARCDAVQGVVKVERGESGFIVSLTPALPSETGPFQFNVQLLARADDGSALPPVPLRVRGTFVEDVIALPPVLLLDRGETDERAERELVLTSHSGQGFRVVRIDRDNDGLTVRPASGETDNAHSAQAFRVSQTGVVGERESEIRFEVLREGDTESRTVPVKINYHVMPANDLLLREATLNAGAAN